MIQGTCNVCAQAFEAKTVTRKYCSERCRSAGQPKAPCSKCGEPTSMMLWKQKRTGRTVTCNPCRTSASRDRHGTTYCYQLGCRCEECRRVWNEKTAEYQRAATRDGRYPKGRERRNRECEVCGKRLTSKGGAADGRSLCKQHRDASRPHPKAWISTKSRLAIYERDDWTCQLCFEPVDRDAHYQDAWSPTLDHIEPQSSSLLPDHSPGNLRTAHRWCNSVRGDGRWNRDFFEEVA